MSRFWREPLTSLAFLLLSGRMVRFLSSPILFGSVCLGFALDDGWLLVKNLLTSLAAVLALFGTPRFGTPKRRQRHRKWLWLAFTFFLGLCSFIFCIDEDFVFLRTLTESSSTPCLKSTFV